MLWVQQRRRKEYLWFALFVLCWILFFDDYQHLTGFKINVKLSSPIFSVVNEGGWVICGLMFVHTFLSEPLHWLSRAVVILTGALSAISAVGWLWFFTYGTSSTWFTLKTAFQTLYGGAFWVVTLFILFRARKTREARRLALPWVLMSIGNMADFFLELTNDLGWQHKSSDLGPIVTAPFPIYLWQIGDALFLVVMAWILLDRFSEVTEQETRHAAELDAARTVQQRLVPALLPEIPGLHLQAAYLPASEVGGDFYQVIRQPDASTLIAVGDVSGKGLKAAMTGTLAIGSLRVLAAQNLRPAQVLATMNEQIAATRQEGFVTMICARFTPDTNLAVANAGHLHPYLNGEEVLTDDGLPLGITPESKYTETEVQVRPGDRLTFVSDGVVEARNSVGELFGFERTRSIGNLSPESIAETARKFGQEDDITVLTVLRVAAPPTIAI